MKQCHLRNPLVNSLVLIAVISLLIGFMLSTGGFFSGIWAFIVFIFRTIQWFIALTLAIIFCLAVLVGIFLAAAAFYDKKSAIRMLDVLRMKLIELIEQAKKVCPCVHWDKILNKLKKSSAESGVSKAVVDGEEEVSEIIKSMRIDVVAVREEIETKIENLNNQLQALQNNIVSSEYVKARANEVMETTGADVIAVREEFATKIEELDSRLQAIQSNAVTPELVRETMAGEVNTVREEVVTTDAGLKELDAKVDDIAGKVEAVKAEDIIGDIPVRLEKLEKQEGTSVDLKPLQDQVSTLQVEVATLKEALAEDRSSAGGEVKAAPPASSAKKQVSTGQEDDHRLLSYYDNPTDKQKLSDLVTQTLKKDMTYAQVIKFLIEKMGEEGGKVISEHPSLAKDYIRHCRRSGI